MTRRFILLIFLFTGCQCAGASISGLYATASLRCSDSALSTAQCQEIDFGNVTVGGSAVQKVTLTNNGRGRLNILETGWETPTTAFGATSLPSELGGGASEPFTVSFTPTMPGLVDSVWFLVSNGKDQPRAVIHVVGNGIGPAQAQVSPDSIDFGNVATGHVERRPITVRNDDSVPLVVTGATIARASTPFNAELPGVATIEPGNSVTVDATYAPAAAGSDTSSVTIEVHRADALQAAPTSFRVELAGRSLPVITVDPTTLDFGDHLQGTHTQRTVTIGNAGVAPLDVRTVALTTGTSATITLISPVPYGTTVQPGSSVIVTVSYAPVHLLAAAAESGTLVITSSDPATPSVSVPINANCTDCTAQPPNQCAMGRTCDCGPQSTCGSGGACTPARRVFVSNTTTTGNLGGALGADALCNTYATDALLGGTWKAFLADSTSTPATRFITADVPYTLLDGTVVANDWSGLISGSLQHGISMDECGTPQINAEVWTGVSSPSQSTGYSQCQDFSSTSGSYANVGITTRTGYDWYNVYLQFCDRSNVRLYCVEQ